LHNITQEAHQLTYACPFI